jgi:hypothetical protein
MFLYFELFLNINKTIIMMMWAEQNKELERPTLLFTQWRLFSLVAGREIFFDLPGWIAIETMVMYAMWDVKCIRKCAVDKKLVTLVRLECRLAILSNISFFCSFKMLLFLFYNLFFKLCVKSHRY